MVDGLLYNCAAVLCRGRLLGVVPKTFLPNYREFYELRQFTPAPAAAREIVLAGQQAPFGALIFRWREQPALRVFAEIREDLWVPVPPSSLAALAGATVVANLSASNIVVGKDAYRRELAGNQSARCIAAYLYSAAGPGESTTDLAWDGHALAYENGTLFAQSRRYQRGAQLVFADVDLERLEADRMRQNSFGAVGAPPCRGSGAIQVGGILASASRRENRPGAKHREISLRAVGPGDAGRALRGGLPHPGRGPGEPAARHRHEEARDRQALSELEIKPERLVVVSGIGQAAKAPHYYKCNLFNGLHGRSLPVATAIKASNPELIVIDESGDGCMYGEGGNHFIHAIRRNPDITNIVHNNMVYGLTKGQASPTSLQGFKTLVQREGVFHEAFNPLVIAISLGASFVARTFAGDVTQTKDIIKKAISHKGYALVDILQPCVTYNKLNTYAWFKAKTYYLDSSYDPHDQNEAFRRASEVL